MNDSARQQTVRSPRRRRSPALSISAAVAMLALAGSFAAMALAASSVTIGSASNAKLSEAVVVNAQGRTLYALSPETSTHLLCKSSACLSFWPPVLVPSRSTKLKAGPGVQGHLGVIKRGKGKFQVTLRGLPLYRFAEDHGKDESNGEGIKSYGGTWHVVSASSASTTTPAPAMPPVTPTPTAPTPPTPPSTPGYGY